MNHISKSLSCFITGAALLSTAMAAIAADAPCKPLTRLQQRIVDKADEGMPQLQTFVWMTNRIYGVNMFEVAEKLDQWREASVCAVAAAAAKRTSVAEEVPAPAGRSAD